MTDLSELVPWTTAGLTCWASWLVGQRHSSEPAPVSSFTAMFQALGLGLASLFLASAIHTVCIESLHLCRSHGDGNIGYAVGPVMGIPLYWLLMRASASVSRGAAKPTANPHHLAVQQALSEFLRVGRPATDCPSCGQPVSVTSERTGPVSTQLSTRCGCGRCNERFALKR